MAPNEINSAEAKWLPNAPSPVLITANIQKVYDIVGLYLDPPESAVVLSVDEKSQVQALSRPQPALPMMPGMPEKRTHDYLRNGTTAYSLRSTSTTAR